MLLVFAYHFTILWHGMAPPDPVSQWYLRLISADGGMGTNFFMLLSGFVGYRLLMSHRINFREFLVRRFWRLYPLYFVLCLLYVCGALFFPHLSRLPSDTWDAFVFIVQNLVFLPGLLQVKPLMESAWTMSYIVLFYFIEGGAVALFERFRLSRPERCAALITAGLLWALAGDAGGWWAPRTAMFWFGMAFSEFPRGLPSEHTGAVKVTTAFLAGASFAAFWFVTKIAAGSHNVTAISNDLSITLLSAIALCAFVWVACFGPEWWKRVLSSRILRWLGAASYSYYLTHGFTVKAFQHGVLPALGAMGSSTFVFWSSQAVGLMTSIVVALLIHHLFEQPVMAGFTRSKDSTIINPDVGVASLPPAVPTT